MNTKEIAGVAVATASIVASIIGWIEVKHESLVSKGDLVVIHTRMDSLEDTQRSLATKIDITYIQLGINDIRLRNFEARGINTLNDTDRRIYEGLKQANAELERKLN